MCIISDVIDAVHSTKILAIPSKNGKRQLTVFSTTVSTPESNVICIPVANPHTVRFEHVPPDIFSQCRKSFNTHNVSCIDYISTFCKHSYDAIIVSSMNDVHNQNGYILTHDMTDFLKVNYPKHGVILCKLKKGNHTYNPIAYSHDILSNLVFPTKHYCRIINEEPEWTFDCVGVKNNKGEHIVDNWDHELYSFATPIWAHESTKVTYENNKINWANMPDDYLLDSNVTLRCYEKFGYYPNVDIEIPFKLSLLY